MGVLGVYMCRTGLQYLAADMDLETPAATLLQSGEMLGRFV